MNTIKVLFLTDHTTHAYFDSVYLLSRALDSCPELEVFTASLGYYKNAQFAGGEDFSRIWCVKPSPDFIYEKRETMFTESAEPRNVSDFHFLFLRTLPMDLDFLFYIDKYFNGKRVINNPAGIKHTESKMLMLGLPKVTPLVKLCRSIKDVIEFYSFFPIVLKPCVGYGGQFNLQIRADRLWIGDENYDLFEALYKLKEIIEEQGPFVAMEYLPRVYEGDKRILVVNNKIVGAMLRMPAQGSWLCNTSSGGTRHTADIEPEEYEMVEYMNEKLEPRGIAIYGLDTLIGKQDKRVLSEVNTCCPGGFYSIHEILKQDIMSKTTDELLKYMIKIGPGESILQCQ